MNEIGKGSYLWHLSEAARLDSAADRLESHGRGFFQDGVSKLREKAQKHRSEAAILDLERRAAA